MTDISSLAGWLTEEGHELTQRVYFEDTDFSGFVYHARYLHFLERGRSDYLRLLGVHHGELAAEGLAFAVRRMAMEFVQPARIDDVLTIDTRRGALGGARLALRQAIRRDGELLVEAEVVAVLVNRDGRPRRLPPALRRALGSGGAAAAL
ncbi:MAG TPA: tol-pal system-associated acyl-CoA thioesterase, partial [Afifellaceae bacterium]|nr:tol-pal system-associated acyl-CoA thioesterase [Afifellaceae bacterium]